MTGLLEGMKPLREMTESIKNNVPTPMMKLRAGSLKVMKHQQVVISLMNYVLGSISMFLKTTNDQMHNPNSTDANLNDMGSPNAPPNLVTSEASPMTRKASEHVGVYEPIGSIEISFNAISKSLNMQNPPIPRRFKLISKRLNLTFSCLDEFLTVVTTPGVMASTMTFDLFAIWLDYMLLPTISTEFWIHSGSFLYPHG